MSRPIPVEIIPSHIHLSEADHVSLFGAGHAGTISTALSQHGQYAYTETVEIFGKLKKGLDLRVLGPFRKCTQVELTPTEATLLGIQAPFARSGDLTGAGKCRLSGPAGEVKAQAVVIIPKPHLHVSDTEAKAMRLENGKEVALDILGDVPQTLENVIVRVHPTYRLRLHIHPDLARDHWLTGVLHARLRESHV
ncbi:MAG: putative phosphotransacetylase [Patescibacteria group bacterium]|jgi:propanediol utilization protein|nr:putative phosphotransacetylase [Patescibacteria group bacterium]